MLQVAKALMISSAAAATDREEYIICGTESIVAQFFFINAFVFIVGYFTTFTVLVS